LAEHNQPVPVPETKVMPVGNTSVTVVVPLVARLLLETAML
jgi:hypothetical protein